MPIPGLIIFGLLSTVFLLVLLWLIFNAIYHPLKLKNIYEKHSYNYITFISVIFLFSGIFTITYNGISDLLFWVPDSIGVVDNDGYRSYKSMISLVFGGLISAASIYIFEGYIKNQKPRD